MAKRLILLFLIFLIIYACTPPVLLSPSTAGNCFPRTGQDHPLYPKAHPGDWYAVEDEFITECDKECSKKLNCNESSVAPLSYERERELDSCVWNRNPCKISCVQKTHPIAIVIELGYYSDGSYYAGCPPYFSNIHPIADKYKRTKWQTDRDDCMKLTSENVKPYILYYQANSWETQDLWDEMAVVKRAKNYYKSCLKERGYLN